MTRLLFFLLLAISYRAQSQANFTAPAPEAVAGKIKILPPHPRLLFPGSETAVLREKLGKDPYRDFLHKAIISECEALISQPPVERIQIGRRLLDKSRECLRRVFQLSYAYRMTGEQKFLERAEKEMLAVSAFSDWNPSHFLDVAEMTLAVSLGYDWLFDALPEASRQKIRTAILEKGIRPSWDNKYNSFLRAEHNWNQVCNAGMTFGALAIAEYEPDLATRTVHRALETTPKSMTPYAPDGGYPEGYGYWDYGTSFNVLLISVLETALGSDFGLSAIPGFIQTGGFLQNMIGPSGLVHNWGDSGLQAGLSPAMLWFADKTGDTGLLWNQKQFLTSGRSDLVRNRLIPAALIWGHKIDLADLKEPASLLWSGQGPSPVALMRTSWSDPNAIFVGFKAGSASVNHAHMDAGSFVIDALGERWAMDFGMQNYHSLESKGIQLWGRAQDAQRWKIFRYNNFVHNTLTIDSSLQRVDGYTMIDSRSDRPDHLNAISDLSPVYSGQAAGVKRGIAIRDRKYVVVRDEIKAPARDIRVRWTLLTPATVRIVDRETVELSRNGKKIYMIFNTGAGFELKTWTTDPPNDYDAPNPGTTLVGLETTIPSGRDQAIDVVFSASPKKKPAIEPLAKWPVSVK